MSKKENPDWGDEYGNEEVTVSRNEVAHAFAISIGEMLENAKDEEERKNMILMFSIYGSFVMTHLFDEGKIEKLEIE